MSASPPTNTTPIVQLQDIHRSFGTLKVLRGVTLDFHEGQTTVILGPSGCGKSVMLKHIIGLLQPQRGAVYFRGQRCDQLNHQALADMRQNFGYLFQMSALFDSMTVEENVCFPLAEQTKLTKSERRQRCQQVLAMVELDGTQTKMPNQLSGGQRKRIALARAIVQNPSVILYDEPTTGLDPIRAETINHLIMKLKRDLALTSIVVTHDIASAYAIADRMVMFHEGRIIADGTVNDIRHHTDPQVQHFIQSNSLPTDAHSPSTT